MHVHTKVGIKIGFVHVGPAEQRQFGLSEGQKVQRGSVGVAEAPSEPPGRTVADAATHAKKRNHQTPSVSGSSSANFGLATQTLGFRLPFAQEKDIGGFMFRTWSDENYGGPYRLVSFWLALSTACQPLRIWSLHT